MMAMKESAFSETDLEERLSALSIPRMLVFGASCSERLLPCYRKFNEETGWGNGAQLRDGLDLVWRRALEAGEPSDEEVSRALVACEAVGPDSEDFTSLYTSSAQDAVFAVCALLDHLLEGEQGKIVLAARYPTDSIDLLVQELEGMTPGSSDLEASILASPMMQQELRRQRRDLEELTSQDEAAASIRERAMRESILDRP